MLSAYGVFFREKEEVGFVLCLQMRHLPGVDAVGVDDDLALLGLAEEFG